MRRQCPRSVRLHIVIHYGDPSRQAKKKKLSRASIGRAQRSNELTPKLESKSSRGVFHRVARYRTRSRQAWARRRAPFQRVSDDVESGPTSSIALSRAASRKGTFDFVRRDQVDSEAGSASADSRNASGSRATKTQEENGKYVLTRLHSNRLEESSSSISPHGK